MSKSEHACPHCGYVQRDLWDWDWDDTQEDATILTECGSCEKPIDIIRSISVTYRVEAPEPPR